MEGATAGAKRCFEVLDRQDDVVDSPNAVAISSANGAIALVRDGRTARHIGPLLADNAAAALALVNAIAQSEGSPLLLDAVASQTAFLEGLTASGWTIERPFQRMRFGSATATGEEVPFAVAGPEFG